MLQYIKWCIGFNKQKIGGNNFNVEMLFPAGYMRKLHISVLERYNNSIFNIHPALLPKFGSKGMFGMNVLEGGI